MQKATIVVGLDSSPAAASALRWAARRAVDTAGSVGVVHAYKNSEHPSLRGRALRLARETDARARATRWIKDALVEVAPAVLVRLAVVQGPTSRVLTSPSRAADLLVLGAPAGGRLHRLLSGSVARRCSIGARCPVVLVPVDGAA